MEMSGADDYSEACNPLNRDPIMRYYLLLLPVILSACSSVKPEAPTPPQIGKANPAAMWCMQKGGQRVPVQSPQGVRTECKLPGGEVIDEWSLWRRDHPSAGS